MPRPDTPGAARAPAPEFSRPLRTARLDPAGERLSARATDAERAALARRFGISEVAAMAVEAEIRPHEGGWRVEGRARATVVQPCVVTLEPVAQKIDERFARRFLPGAAPPELTDLDPDEDEDPPEPLGAVIDPAEMASEAVALAIDPYPRKAGAVFGGAAAAPEGAEAPEEGPRRPFAGLAALRARLDRDGEE